MCLSLARHVSHLFQLGEACVSTFSIPGSNTAYHLPWEGLGHVGVTALKYSLSRVLVLMYTAQGSKLAKTARSQLAPRYFFLGANIYN